MSDGGQLCKLARLKNLSHSISCISDHVSSYATAVIRHPCSLVAWSVFFCWNLRFFLAQPGSPEFPGFSFSLSLSLALSFFLVHPYGLGGGISLSPVNTLDYVKKIGKFKMEIPPKNLTRLQGNKGDE